jgi:tetratricopeptide (TPR) repeat protein
MGRRLALVIGVNQYQDAAFRPLQYAEMDAKALAQWLVNDRGGRWQPADVQLVLGAHATRELVETLITQTCVNVAGPSDLVLIYFAGHAFLDEKTGDGYLALANTHYQQASTGLRLLSLLGQSMGQSRAANILFMFDCFQTGQLWSMRRQSPYDSRPLLDPTLLNGLQQNNGRLVLCSCRGNEMAAEAGEKNLGILAYRMIIGLCGPASDPDSGQITLQRLHAFLFNSLGEQQRPQLFGQEQGHVVLVGHTSSLPALSSPSPASQKQSEQPSASFSTVATQTATSSFGTQRTAASLLMSQTGQRPTATASLPRQMSPSTTASLEKQRQEQCEGMLQQARYLIQRQNPVEALQLIEQALQVAPNYLNALILKGQLLGTVGRLQEAIAVVEQAMRVDAQNALLWSMYAALLTNVGRYQEALSAVERSLELDPSNPETYAIKTSIMGHVAATQSMSGKQQALTTAKRGGPVSFLIALGIALLGLLIGAVGGALPILQPNLPIAVGILLESVGLALLCVNAARGSYLYGFTRLLLTTVFSLLSLGILGALYFLKPIYGKIIAAIQDHPPLLVPFLFLAAWLIVAAVLPLLLSIGGLIAGLIRGVRRKR